MLLSAVLLAATIPALTAENISADEAKLVKLESLGNINVSESGAISCPIDLHPHLSKLADEKGGIYFVIIAVRQHGNNFDAVSHIHR